MPGCDQREDLRVGAGQRPDAVGEPLQVGLPALRRNQQGVVRTQMQLGDHPVDNALEQVLTAVDVAIKRHRLDVELSPSLRIVSAARPRSSMKSMAAEMIRSRDRPGRAVSATEDFGPARRRPRSLSIVASRSSTGRTVRPILRTGVAVDRASRARPPPLDRSGQAGPPSRSVSAPWSCRAAPSGQAAPARPLPYRTPTEIHKFQRRDRVGGIDFERWRPAARVTPAVLRRCAPVRAFRARSQG